MGNVVVNLTVHLFILPSAISRSLRGHYREKETDGGKRMSKLTELP